ncbi:MAG: BrnA antitoxin family protein [Chloroflexi bacterium]|nr:BrnA antitoxin family protein [Chloroflexota bacterium]MCI0648927.1 BrnA antitoxin family protein [Chloroflexota bacterium]
MSETNKQCDPIPEEFESYEDAAAFWETHDTTEYPDAFTDVDVVAEFRGRYFEVELAEDVAIALQRQARRSGVTMSELANDLLRKQIIPAG